MEKIRKKRKSQFPARLSIRIEKKQREEIEKMAKESNQSLSEVARELVLLNLLNTM
mgnify:CR=1 FL=1